MQRVAIIGSGGAGKSTFARRLAAITGLPLIHLDREFWRPGWTPTPEPEWEARVAQLVSGDRWILDGNYGGTMAPRFAAADTVVWLDYPRMLCTWRAFQRGLRRRGGRPDMAPGCSERVDRAFLWWVWTYPERRRPGVKRMLRDHAAGKRVFVLRGDGEAARFLAQATMHTSTDGDGIRPATRADGGAIAAIHTGGWRAAYGHILSEDVFRSRPVDVRLVEYAELLADLPPEERVWVALREGRVAGFAYTRPGVDGDIERGGELKLFYVRPNQRGGGIGLPLFQHAVADLQARGYAPYLYTLEENAAARRWYEKRSWRHDGRTQPWSLSDEHPGIEECRYRPGHES